MVGKMTDCNDREECTMECTLTEPFEALMYEYLCSACGSFCDVEAVYGADEEMPRYCPNCGRKVTRWK